MVVTASPAACQAAYNKGCREVRKEISLPGFRKGHVPEEMVLRYFGPQVERRTHTTLLSTAFEEAIRLVDRKPFAKNSLRRATVRRFSKEKGGEILFEYESYPQVPTIEIEKLKIEAPAPKLPTDEDVEEFYTRMRMLYSQKKPAEHESVQDGDSVKIEFSHSPDLESKGGDFYVHKGLIPEWLYAPLLGMKASESKEIAVPPKSSHLPPSTCTVKLLQIFDCILPEENEAFTSSVGVKSIDELRNKIKARLEFDAKNAAQERMRRQVRNELIRTYAFDLPQSLVEGETDARFLPYWETASKESSKPLDKESMRKSFLEEVKRQFTIFFLLQPLFAKIKPSYTNAEVMDELNFQTTRVPVTQCVLHPKLKQEEIFDRLLSNIIMRQCEDYCIEQRLGISPPHLSQEQTHENLEDVRECAFEHEEGDTLSGAHSAECD